MNSDLMPGDYESILIGAILKFGKEAALAVMPQLTADKFICHFGGGMGGEDNKNIYRALEQIVLVEHGDPTLNTGAIRTQLGENLLVFAEGHLNELTYRYKIDRIDVPTLRTIARHIHKQGIVYKLAQSGEKLSRLTNPEVFVRYLPKVQDPETWAASVLDDLYAATESGESGGYQPTSSYVEEAIDQYQRQFAGEQTFFLPNGFPALYDRGLFPAECMALIHGLSSGGKSTLVENVIALGTAIEMVYNNVKGCIAINSLEMNRIQFLSRAAASLAGFDTHSFAMNPQSVKEQDFNNFLDYMRFVGKLPIWVDDQPGVSMDQVTLRLMGIHLGEFGPIRQVCVDYLEMLDLSGTDESVEQQLAHAAKAHFDLKRKLNACIIAVAQSTYSGKAYIAGLYGARYSKALTHKPDILIEVVNYAALKKSGTDYIVAEGLDEEHVWLLLQKYRGGPTDQKIQLGWEPESTRLYDISLMGIDSKVVVFEHLEEVRRLLKNHSTTTIIPFKDTPLSHLDLDIEGDF